MDRSQVTKKIRDLLFKEIAGVADQLVWTVLNPWWDECAGNRNYPSPLGALVPRLEGLAVHGVDVALFGSYAHRNARIVFEMPHAFKVEWLFEFDGFDYTHEDDDEDADPSFEVVSFSHTETKGEIHWRQGQDGYNRALTWFEAQLTARRSEAL